MRLRTAFIILELLFAAGLLVFVLNDYIARTPVPGDVFLTFVFFPFSVLLTVMLFSYYISIRFGKSIVAYGLVLGLALSLAFFAVTMIPPLLSLGLALYLMNRLLILLGIKEIREIGASLVADHMISFQVASLILLAMTREYGRIFEKFEASSLLLLIIIVWYLLTIFYNVKELSAVYRKWSRSE